MRKLRLLVTLFVMPALAGCMVGPDYSRPKFSAPPAFKEAAGWMPAAPADAAPKGDWWALYGDAGLDRLEPLVAVHNQTLAADFYSYEEAIAVVREARGGLFPEVGLTGSATRNSAGGGTAGIDVRPRNSGTFEGSASWSPDIWGKIRRQVQADVNTAQASAADLANATLSEQGLLAADYIDLRTSDALIALYRQTVAADQESLRITQNQFDAGVAARSDVLSARTQLDGAQAALINEGAARAQYEHAIAVLAGQAPADLTIPAGALMSKVPVVPAGVPSALLERRPDIAAAERRMAAQNALIGVAVGAYYPDLSLSAVGGYAADPIGGLFSVSNALWSLGTNATETLFAGGTRSAAVAAAEFSYDQAVAAYRQTVLTAFQDVEDDLSNLRILAAQAEQEDAAVADASQAAQIALNEYEAGTQAYTAVVSAQLTLHADQQTALAVRQNRLLASVALIQDTGGGFTSGDLPGAGALPQALPSAP